LTTFLLILFDIIQVLLNVVWWIIIIQAILSILIAFNVINTYNDFVAGLWRGLNTLTEPVYRPIRRILPDLGPLDLSPFVVLIAISIIGDIIIPRIAAALMTGVA
jgi:YggT family protein